MNIRKWLESGAVAVAAALVAAPLLISGSIVNAAPSTSQADGIFRNSSLNVTNAENCYEYKDSTITDATVQRTDKSWGSTALLKPDKRNNWLKITQGLTAELSDGTRGDTKEMPPCVVVRGDENDNYTRTLYFDTFSTDGDPWATTQKARNQSVDIFMNMREAPAGGSTYVSGLVRSENVQEFHNNIMVDAAKLAKKNNVTLKAPMKIADANNQVNIHFTTPGYYAVQWSAEMNMGSTKLYSNTHIQIFKVITHDAPDEYPPNAVVPQPTDPSTQPSSEPSTDPSTEPSAEPSEPSAEPSTGPGGNNGSEDPVEPTEPSTKPSTNPGGNNGGNKPIEPTEPTQPGNSNPSSNPQDPSTGGPTSGTTPTKPSNGGAHKPGNNPGNNLKPDGSSNGSNPGGSTTNPNGNSNRPGANSNNAASTPSLLRPNVNLFDDNGRSALINRRGGILGDQGSVSPENSGIDPAETLDQALSDRSRLSANPNQGLTDSGILSPDAFPNLDPEKARSVASPQEASKQWAKAASTSVLAAGAAAVLIASGVAGIALLRKP